MAEGGILYVVQGLQDEVAGLSNKVRRMEMFRVEDCEKIEKIEKSEEVLHQQIQKLQAKLQQEKIHQEKLQQQVEGLQDKLQQEINYKREAIQTTEFVLIKDVTKTIFKYRINR